MRPLAISTGPYTHLDHIGVLSSLLNIPLVVTDPHAYALARTYYPSLNVSLVEESDLSLGYLATHFDLLLGCGKFWAIELLPLFRLFCQKNMRLLFCPHGNSDKGYSSRLPVEQDLLLVYGEHMIQLLKDTSALECARGYIVTGNYRLSYYKKHQPFYDQCVRDLIQKKTKKTLLYAPTWEDKENPTSFFEGCAKLVDALSKEYTLLIKPHPLLFEGPKAAQAHALAQQYKEAFFILDFPCIYPLLAHTDIYIGDFSSIGYDFLAFDKPLFFLSAANTPLHKCGTVIPKEEKDIAAFLEAHAQKDLSKERQALYKYAFGKEKSPENLWGEVLQKAADTS